VIKEGESGIVGYDAGDWYQVLVEDCKAIITEAVFSSRWALIEGYHQLGERLLTDASYQRHAKGNKSSVQDLAQNIGTSERTIYYAMQFYEKFPRLDLLPDGKNISWNKIVKQYLPEKIGSGEWQQSSKDDQLPDICVNCPWRLEKEVQNKNA